MRSLWRFLGYNNAVPVALSFMTLSFGAAFASSDEVRSSVYDVQEKVVLVDNTYIANKDLTQYMPRVEIVAVTEDAESYYVAYRLSTIDIVDHVWQDVLFDKTLTVSKALLGETVDLGIYVTRQLNEVTQFELARLKETQIFERRAVSQKTIATEYTGLVGRFLDPTTQTLPGYTPVVVVPDPVLPETPMPAQTASAATVVTGQEAAAPSAPTQTASGVPQLTVLGANPAQVPVGASYVDLGVIIYDPPQNDATVVAYLDESEFGTPVGGIIIDTSTHGTWQVRYVATDADGNTAEARRTVIVGMGTPPVEEPAPVPQADAMSETEADPAAEPVSEPEMIIATEPEPEPEESETTELPTGEDVEPAE